MDGINSATSPHFTPKMDRTNSEQAFQRCSNSLTMDTGYCLDTVEKFRHNTIISLGTCQFTMGTIPERDLENNLIG